MPDFTARVIDILRTDRGGRCRTDAELAKLADLLTTAAEDHYRPRTGITHEQRRDAIAEVIHRRIDTADTFNEIADEVLRVLRVWYPSDPHLSPGAGE